MQRRKGADAVRGGGDDANGAEKQSIAAAAPASTAAVELRRPRHGGWQGTEPGREAQMLRGEPGYHLGLFRIAYGALLVQRTLTFMSSGAVDASFAAGENSSTSPGGATAMSVLNFGHGFLLLGNLGSPSADAVRSACWCLCAAGVAISIGFRQNAVAFTASIMQFCLLLMEKSVYTDEAYLFALVALLLSFTDCGKTLGLDAVRPEEGGGRGGGGGKGAALRDQPPDTVPHWHLVLLRFQVCIVHIHRGLAKASTADWLLRGQPLLHRLTTMPSTHWLPRVATWAVLNEIPGLGGGDLKAFAVRASGSMIFLDLFLGISLLAAPHYRPVALALQTAVHLARAALGPADARAWHLLIVATGVLFMDPCRLREGIDRAQEWLQPAVSYDTPGRGAGRGAPGRRRSRAGRAAVSSERGSGGSQRAGGTEVAGTRNATGNGEGIGIRSGNGGGGPDRAKKKQLPLQAKPSAITVALVFAHVLTQALLPLRHVLGVFPVEWSREGHEFSWRAGGGVGGRGGGGGLVAEEALVRVTHRPRIGGRTGKGSDKGVQTVHLYGAPLSAQQVLRMVLDPDMLLQLAKISAESSPAADGGRGGGRRGRGRGTALPRVPPVSSVDAWKSINGRPFSRWIDPSVDVWDAEFGEEGPSNAEWLGLPPTEAELDRAAGIMEAVRTKWAIRGQRVTFFAARSGQAGLSNIFLGAYDPSNFNTTELCSVPPLTAASGGHASPMDGKPSGVGGDEAEAGGILLGVAMGEIQLLMDPGSGGESEANSRTLKVSSGTVLAPPGQGHSVRVRSSNPSSAVGRRGPGALAVWYYVHSCPDGLFHLCVGFLSGAGWEQLYPPHLGTRKGWTMEHGVPKRLGGVGGRG